jgi:hypothetical protein
MEMDAAALWLLERDEPFRSWMVGHEQSSDDLSLQNMPFQDLCHVGFCSDPVPHSFRVDHHTGTQIAMVQAAGFIGAHKTLEIQSLCFAFKMCVKFLRSQVRTTAARIVLGTLIGTDEDVPLKRWHMVKAVMPAWSGY